MTFDHASLRSLQAVSMSGSDLDQPYRGGFIGREHHFALTVYYEDHEVTRTGA